MPLDNLRRCHNYVDQSILNLLEPCNGNGDSRGVRSINKLLSIDTRPASWSWIQLHWEVEVTDDGMPAWMYVILLEI